MAYKSNTKRIVQIVSSIVTIIAGIGLARPARATPLPTSQVPIINDNSNLCMAVDGGTMQTNQPVIQWDCIGTEDQYWTFVPKGEAEYGPGLYEIQNYKDPSYCLDGTWVTESEREGAQLFIYPCSVDGSDPGELWSVYTSNSGATWVLPDFGLGGVAAAWEASTVEGTPIILWDNQIVNGSHPEQQWYF